MAVMGVQVVVTLLAASLMQKMAPHCSFARWLLCNGRYGSVPVPCVPRVPWGQPAPVTPLSPQPVQVQAPLGRGALRPGREAAPQEQEGQEGQRGGRGQTAVGAAGHRAAAGHQPHHGRGRAGAAPFPRVPVVRGFLRLRRRRLRLQRGLPLPGEPRQGEQPGRALVPAHRPLLRQGVLHGDAALLPLGGGRRTLRVPRGRLLLPAARHAGPGGARGVPGVRPGGRLPLARLAFKLGLVALSSFLGACLTFPGLRLAQTHLDALSMAAGKPLTQVLLHVGFVAPVLVVLLWVRPLARDFLLQAPLGKQTVQILSDASFDTLRLWAVVALSLLRLLGTRHHLQAYLALAERWVRRMRRQAGRIPARDIQRQISRIYCYVSVVSLQYLGPVILTLHCALLLKTLGHHSWGLYPRRVPSSAGGPATPRGWRWGPWGRAGGGAGDLGAPGLHLHPPLVPRTLLLPHLVGGRLPGDHQPLRPLLPPVPGSVLTGGDWERLGETGRELGETGRGLGGNWGRLGWTGMDWDGLGGTGRDWEGLGRTGTDWDGLGGTGCCRSFAAALPACATLKTPLGTLVPL
uniref:Transmembrane protein 161A n=1 Tax=Geospiza parvula TaxID=87175 RepID=A0A8U8C1I4_GEOPR